MFLLVPTLNDDAAPEDLAPPSLLVNVSVRVVAHQWGRRDAEGRFGIYEHHAIGAQGVSDKDASSREGLYKRPGMSLGETRVGLHTHTLTHLLPPPLPHRHHHLIVLLQTPIRPRHKPPQTLRHPLIPFQRPPIRRHLQMPHHQHPHPPQRPLLLRGQHPRGRIDDAEAADVVPALRAQGGAGVEAEVGIVEDVVAGVEAGVEGQVLEFEVGE